MIVTIFRTRIQPGVEQELAQVGGRMYELASAMPGFVSYKDYAAEDGEYLSLIEFDSLASLAAWREHPEHKAAQAEGRERLFSEYRIQVCEPLREYEFKSLGQNH